MSGQASRKVFFQKRTGSGPYTYTTIPGVTDVEIKAAEREDIDVTDLTSDQAEFEAGLPGQAEVTVSLNHIVGNAEHIIIEDAANAGTTVTYCVFFPKKPLVATGQSQAGTRYTITGYFRTYGGPSAGKGNALTASPVLVPSTITRDDSATMTMA